MCRVCLLLFLCHGITTYVQMQSCRAALPNIGSGALAVPRILTAVLDCRRSRHCWRTSRSTLCRYPLFARLTICIRPASSWTPSATPQPRCGACPWQDKFTKMACSCWLCRSKHASTGGYEFSGHSCLCFWMLPLPQQACLLGLHSSSYMCCMPIRKCSNPP